MAEPLATMQQPLWLDWDKRVPDQAWTLYRAVLEGTEARGLPLMVGGALAYSAYAHRWRDTKDIDLYVRPCDRQATIDVIQTAGFVDYHDQSPYDRAWIFRGIRDGVIVDVIWQMANYRAQVDETWLSRGRPVKLRGVTVRLLAIEELLWTKLYVLQRERCDWPDLLNLVFVCGATIDWEHVLRRLGEDAGLLGGLLKTYAWLRPVHSQQLPAWIWDRLDVLPPQPLPDGRQEPRRASWLDRRDWFGPTTGGTQT